MKTINVNHPSSCGKINATIYAHFQTELEAKKSAEKIVGGFYLKNNTTKQFTVFYPSTKIDVANNY